MTLTSDLGDGKHPEPASPGESIRGREDSVSLAVQGTEGRGLRLQCVSE